MKISQAFFNIFDIDSGKILDELGFSKLDLTVLETIPFAETLDEQNTYTFVKINDNIITSIFKTQAKNYITYHFFVSSVGLIPKPFELDSLDDLINSGVITFNRIVSGGIEQDGNSLI